MEDREKTEETERRKRVDESSRGVRADCGRTIRAGGAEGGGERRAGEGRQSGERWMG